MDVIVDGHGLFVGKYQGRIRVFRERKVVQETPIVHIKQIVVVARGVSISSDVI